MSRVTKRSYRQHCAVARALDVIGERWTLLVVRELLLGPRRYKDLLDGLSGIGTNLLAARLRELKAAGLVRRRTLPPPAGSTVYELTTLGQGLRPALLELGRWGATFLGRPTGSDEMRPGWYVVSMLASVRPAAAEGLDASYELRIDDEVFHIRLRDGEATIGQVPPDAPDLVVTADLETFLVLLSGDLAPTEGLEGGRVETEGDPATFVRFVEIFRWPTLEAA